MTWPLYPPSMMAAEVARARDIIASLGLSAADAATQMSGLHKALSAERRPAWAHYTRPAWGRR